jgi:hypothetical protein
MRLDDCGCKLSVIGKVNAAWRLLDGLPPYYYYALKLA